MDRLVPGFGRRRASRAAAALVLLVVAALMICCGGGKGHSSATAAAPADTERAVPAQTVDVVRVVSQKLDVTVRIPGELQPYEVVAIYPKVTAFVNWIGVDRGSKVKEGQIMARLEAPELTSQRAEAQAKLQSAVAQQGEAEAKLAGDASTYQRLEAAARTPGVVSGNELEVAQKTVEADRSRARAAQGSAEAAREALRSVQQVEGYLQVKAPFDGIVTERNVHPGALVGPASGPGVTVPVVRVEKVSRLRLIVPVPEAYVAGISEGTKVSFAVTAFPGQTFSGTVTRVAHSVDVKTRSMPVELDVANPSGRLASGMFAETQWPVRRAQPSLFVPPSAVVRTTERTFVVRVRDSKAEWVDVKIGATAGRLEEIFGDLREGDQVALRATDELRPGARVVPRGLGI